MKLQKNLYFVKNNTILGSEALFSEAEGLEALRAHLKGSVIRVPKVLEVSEKRLVLERILAQSCSAEQSYQFGKELAFMHRESAAHSSQFGWAQDNYIGLNPQKNGWCEHWGEFFLNQRLGFQISLVRDKPLQQEFAHQLGLLKSQMIAFLNERVQKPSLLHGDLWSGNYLCDQNSVWLIDPAVYWGDNEVDLAMTEMFGGFACEFYEGYEEILPKSEFYPLKRVIYNLYHYLNHYNLFGASYLHSCRQSFAHIKEHPFFN